MSENELWASSTNYIDKNLYIYYNNNNNNNNKIIKYIYKLYIQINQIWEREREREEFLHANDWSNKQTNK